jgi:hypothetical protein
VTVFLDTERLVLRAFTADDVDHFFLSFGADQGEVEYGLDLADWIRARR